MSETKRAQELDPLSTETLGGLGHAFLIMHRYDESIPYFQKALDLYPDVAFIRAQLAWSYAMKRMYPHQAHLEYVGKDPCWRTMLLIAVSFGLRISEVFGLKWKDVDWFGKTISIERGVVKQIVGDVKSKGSARKMACAEELLQILRCWKQCTHFPNSEDWIFASPYKLGRQPLCYTLVWETLSEAAERVASATSAHTHSTIHSVHGWIQLALRLVCSRN